jgi:hypothetical protein
MESVMLRRIGDRNTECDTVRVIALIRREQGRHDEALDLARTSLALAREVGDRRLEADALLAEPTAEGLAAARSIGGRMLQGQAFTALAVIQLRREAPEPAAAAAPLVVDTASIADQSSPASRRPARSGTLAIPATIVDVYVSMAFQSMLAAEAFRPRGARRWRSR